MGLLVVLERPPDDRATPARRVAQAGLLGLQKELAEALDLLLGGSLRVREPFVDAAPQLSSSSAVSAAIPTAPPSCSLVLIVPAASPRSSSGGRPKARRVVYREHDPRPRPWSRRPGTRDPTVCAPAPTASARRRRRAPGSPARTAATAEPVERPSGQRPSEDDRERARDQRDAGDRRADTDDQEQEVRHQEPDPELHSPGKQLADVGGQEVQMAEQPKLEERASPHVAPRPRRREE